MAAAAAAAAIAADGAPALHIAMFPWLAFGHMIPMLELSKYLARRGHRISFLSTPRNLARLPPPPPLVHFVPLPLPTSIAGLPAGAEATSDVSPSDVQHLKVAIDTFKAPFADFLDASNPDWIVLDFATPWAPAIATEHGIPCAMFSVFTASFLAFFGPPEEMVLDTATRKTAEDFTVVPNWAPPSSNLRYSLHVARILMSIYDEGNASGISDARRYKLTLEGCKIVAPRCCVEVEGENLDLLRKLCSPKPVVPMGYLPPPPPAPALRAGAGDEIFRFLDNQAARSVLYVAFGSEAQLSSDLLRELALGLEISDLPFLWALRSPSPVVLPEGFEDRIGCRGIVVKGWVPQLEVLGHEAVGGFLSHAGWTSVTETMQFGVPMVLLPIFGDQGINARVVQAGGFGVELPTREEDGAFDRAAVARTARLVMVEEGGAPVRKRAMEMVGVFGDRERHERYIDEFVACLRKLS